MRHPQCDNAPASYCSDFSGAARNQNRFNTINMSRVWACFGTAQHVHCIKYWYNITWNVSEMCELNTCIFSIKAGAYRCFSAVSFFQLAASTTAKSVRKMMQTHASGAKVAMACKRMDLVVRASSDYCEHYAQYPNHIGLATVLRHDTAPKVLYIYLISKA